MIHALVLVHNLYNIPTYIYICIFKYVTIKEGDINEDFNQVIAM